jgi:hypothetical protein
VYAIYDTRTDQFSKVGKPYGSKPGFYLVVGPHWKGDVPAGMTAVLRSSTEFGMVKPRLFQNDTAEDRKAIQPFINQVMMRPALLTSWSIDLKRDRAVSTILAAVAGSPMCPSTSSA